MLTQIFLRQLYFVCILCGSYAHDLSVCLLNILYATTPTTVQIPYISTTHLYLINCNGFKVITIISNTVKKS